MKSLTKYLEEKLIIKKKIREEEFENEIKKAVMLLLNANQIMTIRYDEKGLGIVAIEYADQSYSDYCPYWLLPDEIESVIFDEEREQND